MKKFIVLLSLLIISLNVVAKSTVTHVTVTYYQPVKAQCNSKPLVTADGSKINLRHLKQGRIKWCAISRDLLWLFPKGKPKRIYIEGFGTYYVKDVMNRRFTHRVDILIHPKDSKRIKLNKVKIKIL
nr:MAG TPA: 3D containing protein [Caudoviricetes sp.]